MTTLETLNAKFAYLDPRIVRGARVRSTETGSEGVVTRVISTSGLRGGIAEVRWSYQKRVSRSAGFQHGDTLEVVS